MRTSPLVLIAVVLLARPSRADEKPDEEIEHAGSRWRIGETVATGSMPWGVSVSPDGGSVYVSHVGQKDRDTVRRYAAATLEVLARARFRGHAVESIPTADGARLYVTNSRRHEVVVLDGATLEVTARHRTGKIPKDFRVSPDGARLYVADYGDGTLSVIDVESGDRRSVAVGKRARGVAVSRDGATVYVTSMAARTVSVVDTATLEVTATATTCASPRHLAVTADGLLLVTCLGARHVDVLDGVTGERVRRIAVGKGPKTIAITGDGRVAITADERSDTITLIDLATWETRRIAVPIDQPCGLAVSPADDRIYVTGRGSDELLVIDRSP